mmetsp:Transcript_39618/g.60631  ORF Transcript_39618/g.60631 Transcript_39618/m.60631 type:complete len:241 (+) Transcript_39618:9722-10444(+)
MSRGASRRSTSLCRALASSSSFLGSGTLSRSSGLVELGTWSHSGVGSLLVGREFGLLKLANDQGAEQVTIGFCFKLHHARVLDDGLFAVSHLREQRRHQADGVVSVEGSGVSAFSTLQSVLSLIDSGSVVFVALAREGEEAAGVNTDGLDLEALCGEVATLHKQHFVDVVGHSREELDDDLETLACDNLTSHVAALDDARPRHGRKVDVELEGHLSNVLDVELLGGRLVIRDLSVDELGN